MDKTPYSFLMRHASLRQLQVLEAVGRHLSFTRAAEELHLAQPTVSAQIRNLSEAAGAPLFEQIGKRVYLTEMGRVLYAAARKVFEALVHAEMEIDEMKGLKRGLLRLAVVTTAKNFAPRVLGAFCERYPGIDVALKVTNRERLLERLVDNLDDIYIIGQPPESPGFVFEHFLANTLVAIAAKHHPLAHQHRIRLEDFALEPFLTREGGAGTRVAVEQHMRAHRLQLNIRMELGSSEVIKQAVVAGLGVSIISSHTLFSEAEKDGLAILDVDTLPIQWPLYVGHLRDKHLSPATRTFLAFLQTEGRGLIESAMMERLPGTIERRRLAAHTPVGGVKPRRRKAAAKTVSR